MQGDLIDRARAGDRAALESLLEELAPSVYRFGRRMCSREADAQDVVQDTLLTVAQKLSQFEGRASLSSWVFALARSACARRRRGLKNQPHLPEEAAATLPHASPGPEQMAERSRLAHALDAALAALPDEQREVVWLRDVEGLTAPEAAEALGLGVGALKSRLHRARAALRTRLAGVMEQGAPAPGPGCPEVARLYSQKLEGDLSAETCASMEAHLAQCDACTAACDELREAVGACQTVARRETQLPQAVQERVRQALRAAIAADQLQRKK